MSYLRKLPKSLRPFVVGMFLLIALASVAYAAPEGIFNDICASASICRETVNTGTGIGLYGTSAGGASGAVRGYTGNSSGFGVYGNAPNNIGVRGAGSAVCCDQGGYFSGYDGARGQSNGAAGYGVWATASGTGGYGVYASSSQAIGVRGSSSGTDTGDYGGQFSSTRRGLYANGASGYYDGFFPDCIRVRSTTYGNCITAVAEGQDALSSGISLMAVNNSKEALAPGDVVVFSGFTTMEGSSTPLILVEKASGARGEAVLGVMQSAYAHEMLPVTTEQAEARNETMPVAESVPGEEPSAYPELAVNVAPTDNPDEGGYTVAGNAEPGQQLLVQIQGIALINVDASTTAILAGDTLIASQSGQAITAPRRLNSTGGLVVGRALESLGTGTGTIYVLLGVR